MNMGGSRFGQNPAILLRYFCRPLCGLEIFQASRTWGLRPRLYARACSAGFMSTFPGQAS
jgi:hypothetical protein